MFFQGQFLDEDQSELVNIAEDTVQSLIPSIHTTQSLSSPIQFFSSTKMTCSQVECSHEGLRTVNKNIARSLNDFFQDQTALLKSSSTYDERSRASSTFSSMRYNPTRTYSRDRLEQDRSKRKNMIKSAGDGWF